MRVSEEFIDSHVDTAWLQDELARHGVVKIFNSAVLYSDCGVLIAADLYRSIEPKITHPFVRVGLEDFPL